MEDEEMTMIFTEHMKICPMTKDELLKKIDLTTDKDEREAYKEMLAGGENNPVDEWVWNVPWKMVALALYASPFYF